MDKLKFFYALGLIIFLEACAFLDNPQGLLTLKELGANQKEKELYIENQIKSFNKLREDIENNRLKRKITEEKVLSKYGEPILIKEVVEANIRKIFLYRHPTNYFSSQKIYLYFDKEGYLEDWEFFK